MARVPALVLLPLLAWVSGVQGAPGIADGCAPQEGLPVDSCGLQDAATDEAERALRSAWMAGVGKVEATALLMEDARASVRESIEGLEEETRGRPAQTPPPALAAPGLPPAPEMHVPALDPPYLGPPEPASAPALPLPGGAETVRPGSPPTPGAAPAESSGATFREIARAAHAIPPPGAGEMPLTGAGDAAEQAAHPETGGWRGPPELPRENGVVLLAASLALALPLLLSLYHRLRRDDLLRHGTRARVYRIVRARPGVTAAEVSAELGAHFTTAEHHLRLLAAFGWIVRRRAGRNVLHFVNEGRLGDVETRMLAESSVGRENLAFLGLVARCPGMTQARAARLLGKARSTVSRRVALLEEAGLLERQGAQLNATARARSMEGVPPPGLEEIFSPRIVQSGTY